MYAVIVTGGNQYRVQQGDVIQVEKLDVADGEQVSFDVLMLAQDGGETKIGTPMVEGAKVEGRVLGQGKGGKVVAFKYRSKKNSRTKQGHRQPFTKVEIMSVIVGGAIGSEV